MHALILALHGTGSGSYLSHDHTTTTMTSTNTTVNNYNISILGDDSSGSDFAISVAAYFDVNTGPRNVKPKQLLSLSLALFFKYQT